ncbi:MAG TPA: DUF932 domain-containing protein [Polyangiaceae bacterium LLY-WYZ-15_(1-7)]|nr:DUF932 domain-containing protein [Polyangiaceae bacterium LLY-WYZ-15_(1-7)]HJL22368.1 DUF932 domain-containing protein [Polyangiaceae bacterium LLY-WYZ-15_(1-7)]HJL28362.1 DUF932 domain-containing protein [Polyangiaceae bacterium LLY-WYZ-15_(1-7)]
MTASAPAQRRVIALAPLRPLPDQPERWHSFSTPIPFDEAADRVLDAHRADGERDDLVATDLRTWAFGSTDQSTMELVRVPFRGRDPGEPLPLRELAFSQLCSRLSAPAPYLRSLPAKLQMANLNWALSRSEAPALLRLAGSEVRAVLSERYAAADDVSLLDMVADCLDRTGYRRDAMVRSIGTGPHTLLRITLPSEGKAVKVGDVIEHGIDIGNSELGLRSVQVIPVTYRLVCTNGMRAWRSEGAVRLRHIGDPARLHDQLRDAIPVAFAEARGDIERWQRAVDVFIDSALDEIEALRGLGMSAPEARGVGETLAREQGLLLTDNSAKPLEALLRDAKTTAFDVANAITATARERRTAPRLGLEETAHRYLVGRTAA